jgi:hypothetical protein
MRSKVIAMLQKVSKVYCICKGVAMMRKLRDVFKWVITLVLLVVNYTHVVAQSNKWLQEYNSAVYTSVAKAAEAIAYPFLLPTMGDTLDVKVIQEYQNPNSQYYATAEQYDSLGITHFAYSWPKRIPNILYYPHKQSLVGISDCVSYAVRTLSSVASKSYENNAYLQLMKAVHQHATSPFAYKGYVATAYQFAVAFPTFQHRKVNGWQYVCGGTMQAEIEAYNQTKNRPFGLYDGQQKGGFSKVQKGDVLAFGYGPGSKYNGHIMFVVEPPALLTASAFATQYGGNNTMLNDSILNQYAVYALTVLDCSGKKAHFNDSRKKESGIGRGDILIITNKLTDVPLGFVFGPAKTQGTNNAHVSWLGTKVYAISVGRFVGD